ncbi:MAG TPA: PilZ domain-containing protein [Allosphingosinicella sp.]|nr:PilZ domain-containing protein [Allosphingosinicella sp.]
MTTGKETERRGRRRSRVLLSALFATPAGDAFAGKLRDFSCTGAQVETDAVPAVGVELVMHRGEARIAGRVVWARQSRFGFEFLEPIDEAELLVHISGPK